MDSPICKVGIGLGVSGQDEFVSVVIVAIVFNKLFVFIEILIGHQESGLGSL